LKSQIDNIQQLQEASGALELKDMLRGPQGFDFKPRRKIKERKDILIVESERTKKLTVKGSITRNISSIISASKEIENNDNAAESENHTEERKDQV
jgi:hypothetical protein